MPDTLTGVRPVFTSALNKDGEMRTDTPFLSISVICDDRAKEGLTAEHGFSVWLSLSDCQILFDTGVGATINENCRVLGIDIASADILVISHGHYDHAGGLPFVLEHNTTCQTLTHAGLLQERYRCLPNAEPKYIGVQAEAKEALANLPKSRLKQIEQPFAIDARMGLSGTIPRKTPFEDVGGPFYVDPAKGKPDALPDDMAMWFVTKGGLFILTGCCHSGLINTVEHIKKNTGVEQVVGIMGGLHLHNASAERLAQTTAYLQKLAPKYLLLGHCTGGTVIEHFANTLSAVLVEHLHAGSRYTITEHGDMVSARP